MEYPDSDQIEPERALFLYENHCAILVLEDLPVGSEFGIDLSQFRVGEKFKGVKLIPPGVHFVFASAVNKKNPNQLGPRQGFYHEFKEKELVVRKWSKWAEDFEDSSATTDEDVSKYSANLRDLDQYLGAYRYSTYKTYLNLTDRLNGELVRQLEPIRRKICSVPYFFRESATEHIQNTEIAKPRIKRDDSEQYLSEMKAAKETVIRFSTIQDVDQQSVRDMKDESLTKYALDSTARLKQTFSEDIKRSLVELQFAYVTLIMGNVYRCFDHWQRLVELICKADAYMLECPAFFCDFIDILKRQLELVPEDLFEDIPPVYNTIRCNIDIMIQNFDHHHPSEGEADDLRVRLNQLKEFCMNEFKWEFGIEVKEEEPFVLG